MTGAVAILVASLLGSPHCAAMCGPFVAFYTAGTPAPGGDPVRPGGAAMHGAYNGGRLVAYLMLGLLAGSLGLGIDRAGVLAGMSGAAAAVAGGFMVLWGLRTILVLRGVAIGGFHAPRALQRAAGSIMSGVRGKGPIARAGLTGLASGLLPCGWLYVFVAAAAATASPASAALLMAFFWIGTLPVLVALGLGAQRLTGRLGRHVPLVTAAVVVLLGLMPADSLAVSDLALAAPVAEEAVGCTHCGLDVPVGLRVPAPRPQFCCEGCRVAHAILNEYGLEHYYALPERRDRPVRSTGRTYEEFDHDAFHELYVTPTPEGLSRVELYLEGVHCASCVWLVERVPLVIPGVVRAELNVRRALATIEWDAGAVSLSAIARTLDRLGYAAHPFRGIRRDLVRRQEDRAALVRIGVAGAIAVNVMLPALALYSGALSGMEPVYTRFFRWISLVLTVPAMLGPGRVFFTGALGALRTRTLHMDLPIAIALCAGFVRGAINTVTDSGPIYFDGLTMLVFLLLCGRWLQARGQRRAGDAAELLYALTPSVARVVEMETSGAERVREMPANALLPDQLLEVRAGEMLAADGIVVTGNSTVDRALLTGESRPAAVHPGDEIFAGTLNVAAPLRARVTRAGEATRVARILEQVERSAQRRAPVVLLADRMSGWFVAAVLTLAVVVYVVWWRRGSPDAMDNAIALLLVTCPCALALATPLAVTAAIGRAARAGIFIKGADALELLARPARLILDKTGTITEARTTLVAWSGPEWVKPLALALESGSTHPVADGFRRAWTGVIPATDSAGIEHVVGGGIRGTVDGHRVVVGSPSFVAAHAREVPNTAPLPDALSPVWIAVDDVVVARAGFGDAIRTGSHSAISALAKRGWRLSIVSGDDQRAVRYTGAALGINQDSCFGGVSPEEKLAHVERARREGRGAVVMVGDGVNDAAAIAAASVGIGVHGGAEACLATADVYLTSPGLGALVDLTDGAARTMRVIRRNIAFSLAYNVVGAALAVTGIITPLIAALLMPASSLTVLIASWRGRTFEPRAS